MKELPERPNLDHLKKQAKDLLRQYQGGDPAAIARFRSALPVATGKDDAAIAALGLHLRDAQSCLAREYGFASWAELKTHVELKAADSEARTLHLLRLIYAGDSRGSFDRAQPAKAARLLADYPDFAKSDPCLACAIGDEAVLQAAISNDPAWVNRAGGPLNMPPLVAVTHSSLFQRPEFRDQLHRSARLLLAAGADPNQSIDIRWPPASPEEPPFEFKLSALYGAAGLNNDPALTKLLLDAGADPNDGESLYHSLDHSQGNVACMRLLLEAGARIEGSNAMGRVMDFDNLAALRLLLSHGGDPNEPTGSPLLGAIRRRRSPAHIEALLQAGADARAKTPAGVSAYRMALQYGLTEVAELLRQRGAAEPVTEEELFIAACSRGDEQEARRIQSLRPDLPRALPEAQLRLLPELAAPNIDRGRSHQEDDGAVRLMVRLGWPIAAKGGDWDASALNLAVFRGNAPLTRFLLEHGASWQEVHGHGDNACGTLSWASVNEPAEDGDWLGCAKALVDHGMPGAEPDPESSDYVLIGGRRKRFSEDVTEFLLEVGVISRR